MEWTEAREAEAEAIVAGQRALSPHLEALETASGGAHEDITGEAASRWDAFYGAHERAFFKDRNWLEAEFPELFRPGSRVLEVGCGAGNTCLPVLRRRREAGEDGLFLHASDFSPRAVELVRAHPDYDPGRMRVFLHDLAQDAAFEGVPDGSVDVAVAIFVLSALDPARLPFAFGKIARALAPGGLLLFRDYGLHDMTQLRFKPARLVRPDLYLRGDGTAVHYFRTAELEALAAGAGLATVASQVDRRLLVNRHRRLTMYRIWVQSRFRKPA